MPYQTSSFLTNDLVDRIFMFLTDPATLKSLILSSKFMHDVFKTRPNSIIRAICYNIAGPALPQALCVVRHEVLPRSDSVPDDITEWFDSPDNPWSERSPISPINKIEMLYLMSLDEGTKKMEDVFARRHKDRTTKVPLSSDESWRFRRAVYRFFTYSIIFSVQKFEYYTNEDEEHQMEIVNETRKQQYAFLDQFPTEELQELHTVSIFFVKLIESTFRESSSPTEAEIHLIHGPSTLLEAYLCVEASSLTEELQIIVDAWDEDLDADEPILKILKSYLSFPLKKIWKARKITPPAGESHWKSILDSTPVDQQEQCQGCHNPYGSDLWNKTNWRALSCSRLAGTDLSEKMKGQLPLNRTETDLFRTYLAKPTFNYHDFIAKIFELKKDAFEDWNDENWMCAGCLQSIAVAHLHLWLLEKKREDGIPIPAENCWYGYNCRTQTHKAEHAARLNHLCEPQPQYR